MGALPESPKSCGVLVSRGKKKNVEGDVASSVPRGTCDSSTAGSPSTRVRGSDLVGERLLLLVVLSEGTGNATKPTGAACWYRMIAAGSTSLWSLSFRSSSRSSPLVLPISVSLLLPLIVTYPFSVSSTSASLSPLPSLSFSCSPSFSHSLLP